MTGFVAIRSDVFGFACMRIFEFLGLSATLWARARASASSQAFRAASRASWAAFAFSYCATVSATSLSMAALTASMNLSSFAEYNWRWSASFHISLACTFHGNTFSSSSISKRGLYWASTCTLRTQTTSSTICVTLCLFRNSFLNQRIRLKKYF